ncbi:MAG: hypothetical protein SFY69_12220 [Planctomycetota bacterium]|nr:hypothetical protein [Planctomycetota bacterium]
MRAIAVSLCVLAGAGVAKADFFSFASDMNTDGPTFAGAPFLPPGLGTITDGAHMNIDHTVRVSLLWDADEDGPGPAVPITSNFVMQMSLNSYSPAPVSGGFLHSYAGSGSFEFQDPTTLASFLRVEFSNAIFSTFSASALTWGSTGTIQANAGTDAALAYIPGATGPLAGRSLTDNEGFAFTLTALRAMGGGNVPVLQNGAVTTEWLSEGSWSGHAVPAPAGLALALAGLGVFARRRRA